MKVLVVTEPGVDGVFRYVESLCYFLHSQGVAVHLAYSDRRGSERLPKLVAWVEAQGGQTFNLRTSNRPAFSDIGAFAGLCRLIQRVRPDVIHSHSSKAGFLARVLALCGLRTPQVYHPHAYVGMRPTPGRIDGLYNSIEALLGRFSCTVAVSSDEKNFSCHRLKIPPRRVRLFHNGVDVEKFSPVSAAEKLELKRSFGLPLGVPVLGFMGRSSEQKDPVTLYRAFFEAAARRPMVLFHVGQGQLDPVLDKLVAESGMADRVFRRAYTDAPANMYRAVDGFILTSHYEGFSLAALEALSANLPMVLSEAPGIMDLLGYPLSHVWRARPGDIAGFARGIEAWQQRLADPAAVNHRQLIREHFDGAKKHAEVLGLYYSLLKSRGRIPEPKFETHVSRATS